MARKACSLLLFAALMLLTADSVLGSTSRHHSALEHAHVRAPQRTGLGRPDSAHARGLQEAKGAVTAHSCADKTGYMTMSNINWIGGKDSQAHSADIAERTCNKDPNCIAFNSFGYYIVSKPTGYYPYGSLCTYVKEGKTVSSHKCQEYPGYTTLSNTNWNGPKDSQMSNVADARDACDGNDNCKLFNNYFYYNLAAPVTNGYMPYKGLCSYIKDSEL